uniref:Uncharacterized protein n=1 Tax=Coccolithus braarudii TaxID=221442 RepID=A0A7S0Q5A3_9EUKA|mmetsp:Transcript_36137/g.77081  ORF Transcript_36137/g.77081 Transcript_36137/m.77081 type:complete len:359 (+) Transcript_36137:3-1079(+)
MARVSFVFAALVLGACVLCALPKGTNAVPKTSPLLEQNVNVKPDSDAAAGTPARHKAGLIAKGYTEAMIDHAIFELKKDGFQIGHTMPVLVGDDPPVQPLDARFYWKIVETQCRFLKEADWKPVKPAGEAPAAAAGGAGAAEDGVIKDEEEGPAFASNQIGIGTLLRGPVTCCKGFPEDALRKVVVIRTGDKAATPYYMSTGINSKGLKGTWEPFHGIANGYMGIKGWFIKDAGMGDGPDALQKLGDRSLVKKLARFGSTDEAVLTNMAISARIGSEYWESAEGQKVIKTLELVAEPKINIPEAGEGERPTPGEVNAFIGKDNMFNVDLSTLKNEDGEPSEDGVPNLFDIPDPEPTAF